MERGNIGVVLGSTLLASAHIFPAYYIFQV
jgi:hypothetical protein